ncbi:class I SAM-dependent methyltransferase [Pseudohongiella sp.]|uniref:Methyltransferase type 12 domain-containing protein n=1 Tax=marine sediment metagenome TaxID=412755 RepID=A0A0F9WH92_9ZZZZ|nr:class I SAM-dependent methyltransferase [Pseudohongiella sp.]HDZ08456.1 class I SAM-dependent methyltransferase [Pseudohongiella sp.]
MTVFDEKKRFSFGDNWSNFLTVLDAERIVEAERSLRFMLNVDALNDKTFLDIGSGSGLFSLAARSLGAKVHSFDYDPKSVACTEELRRRYFPHDLEWKVEQGSALDATYLQSLGKFDVVYSWGVLHHTGAMWLGIENAIARVANGGKLYLAIYNDQGIKSHIWWLVKFIYNKLPRPINMIYAYLLGLVANIINILKYTIKLQPMTAISPLLGYKKNRGMSLSHDLIDWMGGFPYEFARYDLLMEYAKARGFTLERGEEATSLGCHQMVFRKDLI